LLCFGSNSPPPRFALVGDKSPENFEGILFLHFIWDKDHRVIIVF
jgi:hypothetical protein